MGLGLIALVAPGLIRTLGWRGSWFFLGILLGLMIMLISIAFIRKDPDSMGLLPDGDISPGVHSGLDSAQRDPFPAGMNSFSLPEAVRTRSYWLLVFGHAGINIPLMGGLSHTAAWGVDILRVLKIQVESGMEVIQFSIFLSAMAAVIGALVGGPLSDRVGRKPIFTASFIMYGSSMIYGVMVTTTVPSLSGIVLFNLSAGFFYGLGMSLWTVYFGDIFGPAHLGALTGLNFFIGGIVGGTGAVIYGWFHDLTGSYAPAFSFGAGCCLLTLILVVLTRSEKKGLEH
jgi:nitrate/nitrite transporter NarK